MKRFFEQFRHGEKGFTLIELLVVVAILGVLAAVAVPNVGKFIDQGQDEALETELHNIQTALMAMLVDSPTSTLDSDYDTADMGTVTSNTTYVLSSYLTGLTTDNVVKSYAKYGVTYSFDSATGTVTQNIP